jgi:hypothetical protein
LGIVTLRQSERERAFESASQLVKSTLKQDQHEYRQSANPNSKHDCRFKNNHISVLCKLAPVRKLLESYIRSASRPSAHILRSSPLASSSSSSRAPCSSNTYHSSLSLPTSLHPSPTGSADDAPTLMISWRAAETRLWISGSSALGSWY